jgi:V8-like Glu-specific endopeptidase
MVLTSSRLASEQWREDDAFVPLTYEKVIGLNNLLNIAWLSRALELAAPVARVVTLSGPGTGFLVGTDLLLTNHHVLPDQQTAEQTMVEFNYQANWAGDLEPRRRFVLDATYFRTNEDLDYTLIRIAESPGDLFGFIDLNKRGDPAVNDFVSIIQHPNGGPKQICFTDNKVSAVFGEFMQYSTDTEPGSSGSPVFNQDWEIVALHHRGGGLAGPDGKKYFTNEGILISMVLRDAASFLGLPDALYDLAFGELRGELVGLIEHSEPPVNPDSVASDLLRTRPRFSSAIDEWSNLNGRPGESIATSVAMAGVAIGGAMRQWARTSGHESISAAGVSNPLPSDELIQLISAFSGSSALPRDVYTEILGGVRAKPTLIAPVVAAADNDGGLPGGARAFLRGVTVGANAYGRPAAEPPSTGN